MSKPNKKMKIDPNKVKTRDYLMVALINGATKSGVHKNRRREFLDRESRRIPRQDEY